jgi:hypothetical protein
MLTQKTAGSITGGFDMAVTAVISDIYRYSKYPDLWWR